MRNQIKLLVLFFVFALTTTFPCISQEVPAGTDIKAIARRGVHLRFPDGDELRGHLRVRSSTSLPRSIRVPSISFSTRRGFSRRKTRLLSPPTATRPTRSSVRTSEPSQSCSPCQISRRSRYFSVQLVDWYTFNFGYVGSRTTGNGGGSYMIAGPLWKGEKPKGIDKVFHCETEFAFAIFRTQFFNPADMENVKKIQAGYKLQTLSAFLKKPAPPAAAEIKWPKIDKKLAESDPFTYLNFLLQFCPAVGAAEVEIPLRSRFAKLGLRRASRSPRKAHGEPEDRNWRWVSRADLKESRRRSRRLGKDENGWRIITSGFGDRSVYNGDWTLRAAVAMAGIYGNDPEEATLSAAVDRQ